MATTSTTELSLVKATPGTHEPYTVANMNGNSDKIDAVFNSTTGHAHGAAHQGAPIQSAGIGALQVTGAKIAAATITPDKMAATAFTSWTPVITQGPSTPTLTNQGSTYIQLGKLAVVMVSITATSAGTAVNDIFIAPLPIAPRVTGAYATIGTFTYSRTGVTLYTGSVVAVSSTNAKMVANGGTGGYLGNTAGPSFAVANGDVISFALIFEAA